MSKAWMPLYIGDYLGDTGHLNQGQHGAYLLLLMHYWQSGQIPNNNEECYCIARAMDEQSRCNTDRVLARFFVEAGGFYRQPRLDAEIAKATKAYQKRASAANSMWSKKKAKQVDGGNQDAMHMQSISMPCDCDSLSGVGVGSKKDDGNFSHPDIEDQIRSIAVLYPKVNDADHLSPAAATVIGEAIMRHGYPGVFLGTKATAEWWAEKWPVDQSNFIPSVWKFFSESEYLAAPEKWGDKRNLGKQANETAQERRSRTNREAIVDYFTDRAGAGIGGHVGHDGDETGPAPDRGVDDRVREGATRSDSVLLPPVAPGTGISANDSRHKKAGL